MRVELAYAHVLTSDCHIFIRRRGVICFDEEALLQRFLSAPAPQHLRYNMRGERAAVRAAMKAKTKTIALPSSPAKSDSDIEFVNNYNTLPLKRVMKDEPEDDLHTLRLRRPRLTITTSPSGSESQPIAIPDSPLLSAVSNLSPMWSDNDTASTASTSRSSSSDTLIASWPHGMYTVDMVDGFLKMDNPMLISRFPSQSDRFEDVFGCKYKQSTYGDQKRRWKRATEQQRQAALGAGRSTTLGLWSTFISGVRLK